MANERTYFFDVVKKENLFTSELDIPIVENEQAIVEAIYNIIYTKPGEKVMDPEFGCDIHRYLFAPLDMWHASQISEEIERAISRSEPRALDLNVVVNLLFDENTYEVEVEFRPATSAEQISLILNLKKIR